MVRGGQDRYVEAGQPGEAEGDRARGRGELKCGERRGGKGGEAVLEMILDCANDQIKRSEGKWEKLKRSRR